jgi:hypothetical protein
MAKITTPDKANGQQHSAAEYNAMKAAINTLYDALFTNGTIGVIKDSALPDKEFSGDQFDGDGATNNPLKLSNAFIATLGSGNGNTTPAPPTVTSDDTANTITATHALGTSEIVMSVNNGAYIAYAPVSVGDVDRAAGYWKFKIKSASGRNESSVVSSPAFNSTGSGVTTPAPPTVTADDTSNTLSASHTLGTSEIVVSTNNSAYVAYSGTISVGDVARASGYWKFKIKSASGRNESSVVDSPAFTVEGVSLTFNDINTWYDNNNLTKLSQTLNSFTWTPSGGGDNYGWAASRLKIAAGTIGAFRFKADAASSMHFGVKVNDNTPSATNDWLARLIYESGKMQGKMGSDIYLNVTTPFGPTLIGQLRSTGTELIAEFSTDSGTTFTEMGRLTITGTDNLFLLIYTDSGTATSIHTLQGANVIS